MGLVSIEQFVDGELNTAAAFNERFNALAAAINGNIELVNLLENKAYFPVSFFVDPGQDGYSTVSGDFNESPGATYFHQDAVIGAIRFSLREVAPSGFVGGSEAVIQVYKDVNYPSTVGSASAVLVADAEVALAGATAYITGALTIYSANIAAGSWLWISVSNPAGTSGTDWDIGKVAVTAEITTSLVE